MFTINTVTTTSLKEADYNNIAYKLRRQNILNFHKIRGEN